MYQLGSLAGTFIVTEIQMPTINYMQAYEQILAIQTHTPKPSYAGVKHVSSFCKSPRV